MAILMFLGLGINATKVSANGPPMQHLQFSNNVRLGHSQRNPTNQVFVLKRPIIFCESSKILHQTQCCSTLLCAIYMP